MSDTIKVIFLDIDGVLNDHRRHANGYCGIDPARVELLNAIVEATGAKLVISSAWRYLIAGGAMTPLGFQHLLTSYGLCRSATVIGHTPTDEQCEGRGPQISRWIGAGTPDVARYVILDDGSPDGRINESLREHHPDQFVEVNGGLGLGPRDVERAIEILGTPDR